MDERRDDTTQPGEHDGAPLAPERTPRNYYYDDGTGYEIYDPAADEDDEDEAENTKESEDAGLTGEG
ncbi:MAG TPA: hypothetical protein VEY11_06620 [Pyrinomonadaceae bacterium]|nr:hypothetical protein [Pyrinomonadaceae bacterium]